jgi:hypothetical protein
VTKFGNLSRPIEFYTFTQLIFLVMIEHFSKWLDLVPLPNCTSDICIFKQDI